MYLIPESFFAFGHPQTLGMHMAAHFLNRLKVCIPGAFQLRKFAGEPRKLRGSPISQLSEFRFGAGKQFLLLGLDGNEGGFGYAANGTSTADRDAPSIWDVVQRTQASPTDRTSISVLVLFPVLGW